MFKPAPAPALSRSLALIALALLAAGCSLETEPAESETELAEADAALDEEDAVTLVRASRFTMTKYGMTVLNHSYTVLVDNLSYAKTITIWGETPSGWQSIQAQYVRSVAGNHEVWEAYTNSGFDRFAVSYQANGQTHWDNNAGLDYTIASDGITLYNDVQILQWGSPALYGSTPYLWVAVNLQNLGFEKQVDVVYTTDGWHTVKTSPLAYNASQYYGYGSAPSPNAAGVEYWTGAIAVDASAPRVEYAIAYEAADETHWDNNFGSNYVVQRTP
jgi:hypothetical protein